MGVTEEELRLILSAKDQMGGVVSKNQKALVALKEIAKAVGVAFAAWRLAKVVIDIGRMGAAVERLNISFRRLAGAAPDEMLNELRKATRGTISDMGLMLNANRAMMLGVTQDAKMMARLTEIAIARGQALGLSAQTSMDRMVTGLGRISTKILDDIGILTGGQKTFDDYAASVGKSADMLTDLEKRQALVNMVLRDTITLTDDSMSSFERAAAQVENLKNALMRLTATPVGKFMGQLADNLQAITYLIERGMPSAPYKLAMHALKELREEGTLTKDEFNDLQWAAKVLNQSFMQGKINSDELRTGLINLHPAIAAIIPVAGDAAEKLLDMSDAIFRVAAAAGKLTLPGWEIVSSIDEKLAALERVKVALEDIEVSHMTGGERLTYWGKKLAEATLGTEEHIGALKQWDRAMSDVTEGQRQSGVEAIRQAEIQGRELVRIRKQTLQELRSTVEGLLQPTAVTDIDMARTRLGTYTDQWDEYIRRVRSAATDAKSAWKHLIPTDILAQGADAIKVWAAETERAFYAGMIPEAIDWEAFDRAFEQFMREKAGREAMVQEAMKRTGATQADIEFMLGYSGDVVQGASAAMKEIAATKGSMENIAALLPTWELYLDSSTGVLGKMGPLGELFVTLEDEFGDTIPTIIEFRDALEKAKKALEPPPPTEPPEPTGLIDPITGETIPTAIAGGAVGHGATVVFAAGSVIVTGTGGPGATRRDTETGMLAALRAAGMPI